MSKNDTNLKFSKVLHILKSASHFYICLPILSFTDYRVLGEIIVQRPIQRETLHLPNKMSDEDLEYIRLRAQQHFDSIMIVLKEMPRSLLLIIRFVKVFIW